MIRPIVLKYDFSPFERQPMLRWLLAVFLAVFIVGMLLPKLTRALNLGHLPGDLACRFRGREYRFPFASTIVLSLLLTLATRFF